MGDHFSKVYGKSRTDSEKPTDSTANSRSVQCNDKDFGMIDHTSKQFQHWSIASNDCDLFMGRSRHGRWWDNFIDIGTGGELFSQSGKDKTELVAWR